MNAEESVIEKLVFENGVNEMNVGQLKRLAREVTAAGKVEAFNDAHEFVATLRAKTEGATSAALLEVCGWLIEQRDAAREDA